MRTSSAATVLAYAIVCASPAVAQVAAPTSNSASAPTTNSAQALPDAVGPAQLKDFSLSGTVVRRAETAPAPAEQPRQAAAPNSPTEPVSSAATRSEAPARPTERRSASAQGEAQAPSRTAETRPFEFSPPTPARATPAGFSQVLSTEPVPEVDSFASSAADSPGGLMTLLPWLVALLAAAGAAVWYFRRQHSGLALAGAGAGASAFDFAPAPETPRPAAKPRSAAPSSPSPAPASPPVAPEPPKGIVSTRLRPWLEIEFVPEAAELHDDRAVIRFEIGIFNSGSAPARDILVEAALFNAGPDQDEAIGAFFAYPTGKGDPIPALPPLQRMAFKHAITMTREQMRLFEVGGRSLFVPLIGFNALYNWSGGKAQTSASYLLGRENGGEKLAPFRADVGSRVFGDVAAREHSQRVRK